ncbi:ABC transporter permease [Alkalihalobacillus pseudalcaliphilus]|uniref:ABC transporter permease n=1 Tax=Alkalihalobacillus pseudalcaliphilus TaxID=79884 RepID=UPI00064D7BF3|nr:ABC transporter permease [Alkalihalobacillus pseudalcaliphilus]KMK75492.1 hypothetical protein AB990_09330 [Alkalihalobacillus pseudalcaliphilus]
MLKSIQADALKMKRKWVWFLVCLGPFGVISLQVVNYAVRYDYLVRNGADHFQVLMNNINMFLAPGLVLGMTILASLFASVEHERNSWKQLLSLPIMKYQVFLSKFILITSLLCVACSLVFIGSNLLGLGLGFGIEPKMLLPFFKNSFYPLLAGIPILVIQLWLSVTMKNQAIPLTIGIFASVFAVYGHFAPDWVLWKWPLLYGDWSTIEFVGAGVGMGMLILLMAALHFHKREVK